jgi:ribokinase
VRIEFFARMTDRPLIVVVGSLNADLVSRVARLPAPGETVSAIAFDTYCGGKGGNQACAAARLGGRVALIGCVGDDEAGRMLKSSLEAVGVDVTAVDIVSGVPSGTALVTVDAAGQNQIIVVPGANQTLTPDRLARHHDSIAAAAIVLLQLEVPLETVRAAARMARAAGARVILDPAPAPADPLADDLLALLADVDYLTPNETELTLIADVPADATDATNATNAPRDEGTAAGDAIVHRARALLRRGVGSVIVTMGDAGAELVERGREHHWSARATHVVDTTGAGDTFNAALAVALAGGAPIEEAGTFACAAASVSVSRAGAQASMPTLDEVRPALVTSDPRR